MEIMSEVYIIIYLIIFQFKQIFVYWIAGVAAGSLVSVFAAEKLVGMVAKLDGKSFKILKILSASVLGIISPVCMYGTVPMIAGLGKRGVPSYILGSFMVSSILLNPNLFLLSFALGAPIAIARLVCSILTGTAAGLLINRFFSSRDFFSFNGFEEKKRLKKDQNIVKIFFSDLNRGIIKTAPYFLIGILLAALFERYFPKNLISTAFGENKGFGVLLSSSLGIPLYICGGGTIPLIKAWMNAGMSPGSVLAFMITGPATKLTNLSALKIILGIKNFTYYIVYTLMFAIVAGLLADLFHNLFNWF